MGAKLSGQSKLVQAIKLILVLVVFPIVIGFVRGLILQIQDLPPLYSKAFYWSIASYLLFHIFLLEPLKFYKRTQKFIQIIFGFFSGLFKLSYYILPFWIVVIIGVYLVVCRTFKLDEITFLFFFLSGFFFSMHIVMVARILKVDELRKLIDYLFIIFIVIIINIFFLALNLKLYEPGFSVSAVGKEGVALGVDLAKTIFNQLFVPQG